MSKVNPLLGGIKEAAAARKPTEALQGLEQTLAAKRRADLLRTAQSAASVADRTNDDCASELDKLRTSNPYRDALMKIGRSDVIADIEFGALKPDEIRAKLNELIMSGDTSSRLYELLSAKIEKMDAEEKKREVMKFKRDEQERNEESYKKMIVYVVPVNKKADAQELVNLFNSPENAARDKLRAPLPTYIESVMKLIDLKIPFEKKEDAYRALFYLLPDKFGGTNQELNENKRAYIYDKIKEAQKKMVKFGTTCGRRDALHRTTCGRRGSQNRAMPRIAAKRTNERMWKRIVSKVRAGSRGGKSGQWSARKAQLAVNMYKKAGGGYKGRRSSKNSLRKWTQQRWRTRSGKNSILGPGATGERYLPEKAIRKLSRKEYSSTTRAKRRSLKKRKQYSKQPNKIARKIRNLRFA